MGALKEHVFPAVVHICRNMRLRDRREIWATRREEDCHPDLLAAEITFGTLKGEVIKFEDGEPIAVLGARCDWPNVANVHLVATDRWNPRVAAMSARWVERELVPYLKGIGVHRAQCLSMVDHYEAGRFLRHIGFEPEGGIMTKFGRNGEDFMRWVRLD